MVHYHCSQCGFEFDTQQNLTDAKCPSCGGRVNPTFYDNRFQQGPQFQQQDPYTYYHRPIGVFDEGPSGKSRGVAGLFAILLGYLGVHYFYLGKISGGILCIFLCFITCGFWTFLTVIQGILMLSMSSEEFERKYANTPSSFPLF